MKRIDVPICNDDCSSGQLHDTDRISTYAVAKKFPRWLSIVLLLILALIGACLLSFVGKANKGGSLAGIYLVNFVSLDIILTKTTSTDKRRSSHLWLSSMHGSEPTT